MDNLTREIIIDKVLEYIDTPFQHQGRVKGVGVDCVGLIICVATELNLFDVSNDSLNYKRIPDGKMLMLKAKENLKEISLNDIETGDILIITFDKDPQHFAFYYKKNDEEFIIHAYSKIKKVLIQRYDEYWKEKTQFSFRFKELN